MAEIDFFGYGRQLKRERELLGLSDLSARNKELIHMFIRECKNKRYLGRSYRDGTLTKMYNTLRQIGGYLEKDFDWVEKEDVDRLMTSLEEDKEKGDWTIQKFVYIFKDFMKWLRNKHWYPEGYPEKETLDKLQLLLLQSYPPEVADLKSKNPGNKVTFKDIPTKEELRCLRNACINSRDRCYFAMGEEVGNRIGGLGSLRIGDIEENDVGFAVYMTDKNTPNPVPVQFFESQEYIRNWIVERREILERFGVEDNPDMPFWLNYSKNGIEPWTYNSFRKMLKRTIERHNRIARESKGKLPVINKRLRSHLIRYFAEIRDQLDGIPENIRKHQRRWSPKSTMPGMYASKINHKEVEDFIRKQTGLEREEKKSKARKCKRCGKVNPSDSYYCGVCKAPLTIEVALKIDEGKKILQEELTVEERLMAKLEAFDRVQAERAAEVQALRKEIEQLKAKS